MLKDLTTSQRKLADYMSELSEEAYCAGWETNLEFDLWECLTTQKSDYGMMEINEMHKGRLRELSDDCGGWITFDDQLEEVFVPFTDWTNIYAKRVR